MDSLRGLFARRGETPAVTLLPELVAANLGGARVGLPSICSAEGFVLEAAVLQALRDDTLLCVESTCNQVNHRGGYTGMTPGDFRSRLEAVAVRYGLPPSRIVLGGDHLGPYPWRREAAASAMAEAAALVRACVEAGYTKLHLDASMRLGGDPGVEGTRLDEELTLRRTAELCQVAEQARHELPAGSPSLLYVIGTEVPVPGGETAAGGPTNGETGVTGGPSRGGATNDGHTGGEGPAVTPPSAVRRTLDLTRAAFAEAGLQDAWERVMAVVVQPGVEFGDRVVHDYDPRAAAALSSFVAGQRPRGPAGHPLVYEAHSTDYQTPASLAQLIEDHFAILKVGPALTFAVREALFALEAIERELLARRHDREPSRLRETLDAAMLAHPLHWQAYYTGSDDEVTFARAFSYSDRARYYWTDPQVRRAVAHLLDTLASTAIPAPLLSQYLPQEYTSLRDRPRDPTLDQTRQDVPAELVREHVFAALTPYAVACGMRQQRH